MKHTYSSVDVRSVIPYLEIHHDNITTGSYHKSCPELHEEVRDSCSANDKIPAAGLYLVFYIVHLMNV